MIYMYTLHILFSSKWTVWIHMLIKELQCYSLATQMNQTTHLVLALAHGKWQEYVLNELGAGWGGLQIEHNLAN